VFAHFDPTLAVNKNVVLELSDQAFRVEVAGFYRITVSRTLATNRATDLAISLRRDTTNTTYLQLQTHGFVENMYDMVIAELPVGCLVSLLITNVGNQLIEKSFANTSISIQLIS
jgi:hypothetical protein